jgi:hypothetical protein
MKRSIVEKLNQLDHIDNHMMKIMISIEKSNKKIELYQKLISQLKKGKISPKEYMKEFEKVKRM